MKSGLLIGTRLVGVHHLVVLLEVAETRLGRVACLGILLVERANTVVVLLQRLLVLDGLRDIVR